MPDDDEMKSDKTLLLGFVGHVHSCDWLKFNHVYSCDWPCTCGLHALIDTLPVANLKALERANPGVVASYKKWKGE